MELRQVDKNNIDSQTIKSKRALQIMLRLDETEYYYQGSQKQQRTLVSNLISLLIEAKCEFNSMHQRELNGTITNMYEVSIKNTYRLRDLKS